MTLDPEERNEIAERLLRSVEPSAEPEEVAALKAEIGRRLRDLETTLPRRSRGSRRSRTYEWADVAMGKPSEFQPAAEHEATGA